MKALALSFAAALFCASCANENGPGPTATALIPDRVSNDRPQTIEIHGQNFFPRIRARFDEPSSSELRGTFQVSLSLASTGAPIQLEATRNTDSLLHFTLPAGMTQGAFEVVVTEHLWPS